MCLYPRFYPPVDKTTHRHVGFTVEIQRAENQEDSIPVNPYSVVRTVQASPQQVVYSPFELQKQPSKLIVSIKAVS